jgi:hypothetical protein
MVRYFPSFHTIAFWCACIFAFLIHSQMGARHGSYASDMWLHVEFILHPGQNEAAGYSLLHTICGMLAAPFKVPSGDRGLVVGGIMMVVLTIAFYYSLILVRGYWVEKFPASDERRVAVLVLVSFVVSMIVLTPWLGALFLGVFTGNPWHNPTYLFARVFAILALVSFLRLTDPERRQGPEEWRCLGLLAAAAVLSMWGKPSFMLTLGPTFGIIGVIAWLRGKLSAGQVLRLAGALVPTVMALLVIRHSLYSDSAAANAVVLAPGRVWGQYTPSYAMSVALAAAFPLYVVLVRGRGLSHGMVVATVNWVVSVLVFYLLAESGPREPHANFAWCYMGGLFFFFLLAIEEWFLRPVAGNRWVHRLGTVLFAGHLISGVYYLQSVLRGGPYM